MHVRKKFMQTGMSTHLTQMDYQTLSTCESCHRMLQYTQVGAPQVRDALVGLVTGIRM